MGVTSLAAARLSAAGAGVGGVDAGRPASAPGEPEADGPFEALPEPGPQAKVQAASMTTAK
jgi:hypothetical protein